VAGDLQKAAVLFKGSLEVQFLLEKCTETNTSFVYEELVRENRYIAQAETILDTMNREHVVVPKDTRTNIRAELYHDNHLSSELSNLFFDPYLFSRPFLVVVSDANDPSKKRSNAATIIFNMALTHHVYDRHSPHPQSYALYQLAMSLLCGQHSPHDVVVLALINNMAVWCYDHDEWDAAQQGMCVLQKIMESPFPVEGLDTSEDATIRWNIERFLTPLGSTSPAG
jgi:hypothetical protein